MLKNFFALDEPYDTWHEAELQRAVAPSAQIRNVLYEPALWPEDIRKIDGISFTNVSLSKKEIRRTTFQKCRFEDCLFIGTVFRSVQFNRCTFINCNFAKCSFENCYIDPRTISFDPVYRDTASNIGVGLYQSLLRNAANAQQSEHAMRADIEFRRWKRWQLKFDAQDGKIGAGERARKVFSSTLYECIAGFGYMPGRFILTTLTVFTAFAVLNMLALQGALRYDNHTVAKLSLADSVFFTYSMMTALGFSTITPITSVAKLLAVFEALFGIGWLGLFTTLLVKRFIK